MISQEELKILKSFADRIPPNDPGAHNNLAIVYYNKSLYDEAVDELEKALKIDPNFVLARNNLDIILKKTGRLEEKVETLARTIEREPYDEQRTLELADTYRKLNRFSQAIIFYRKVFEQNPKSFEAHFGIGITLKLLGKYDDALEAIKTALEIKISPDVYRTLGEIYFHKGVIDLAIRNFQESITLDPSSAEAHFLLGFALGEKGKTNESLEAVRKAIALNPALAQFEPNLPIDIKEHKGHWEFLKEQLGTPRISENEFTVHYNMGITYRNKTLYFESKREFDECLKIEPTNPEIHYRLGQVNLLARSVDDAIKYLQRAMELGFSSAQCINALGVAQCLKGNIEKASEFFHQALSVDDQLIPAKNNLGVCAFHNGDVESAINHYTQAIDAGNGDAKYNLGMYYLNQKKYTAALELFEGEQPDEYFGKGLVYAEQERNDDAIDCFKRTLSLAPNHAGAYYNIGFILTKQGKFKEGLDYIRKGINIEPNYEKNRLLLSLEHELAGYGPHLLPTARIEEQAEEALPQLDIPDLEGSLQHADEYLKSNEYDNALSMNGASSRAILLKAKILNQQNRVEEAIGVLEAFAGEHPEHTDVKAALGQILIQAGQLENAQDIYKELIKIDDTNVDWLVDAADMSFRLERYDDALSYYERLHSIDENNVSAKLGYLRIYIRQKKYQEATPYLKALLEQHTDMYDVNVLAGIYYLERGERDESARYLRKAIDLDASKPTPYYHLGLLNVQRGEFEEACDIWKKALLLSPDEVLAQKIRHCMRMTVELSEFIKKEI
jgi:tetratricopeptide (TPR) repeat protein